ncbi:glycosyltransferase family 69 protein [Trichocladium antarcticum]|uniref:Glycosyltransferase family 69 protein n=1 Tax=Trichocladium antarcticum TaxID=1450529 RepID=A0AAN6ZEH8_9PEZI|nr:glycosyltransferase family 69 protein [Trichocladium antarcticum]
MKPRPTAHRPRILRKLLSRSTLSKLAIVFIIWTVVEAHLIYYRIARAERESRSQAALHRPARVFIASLHWNNEEILRSAWNKGVVDLVKALGPDNVFVSVYESGSWDDSKGALRELDRQLDKTGVGKKIVLDETTHAELIAGPPEDEGWIAGPRAQKALRRIPYLSKLRNLSMQPLRELAENGTTFDHVLFLGDVAFTVPDVIALLRTNNGHYAAACSLDFSKPPLFYDTFALRDAQGHEAASQTWPYFRAASSRKAMTHGEPVPVSSCWNGIVAMPASAFAGTGGLKFRGVDDSLAAAHVEGSECCLIHADNPASRTRGVFLNPTVRVGYNKNAYDVVHPRLAGSWLSLSQIWSGLWRNRLARWFTTPRFKESRVRGRVARWERAAEGREEKGGFCLINEMQVVVGNGWAHL